MEAYEITLLSVCLSACTPTLIVFCGGPCRNKGKLVISTFQNFMFTIIE
jgi:hypothetical protein